MMTDRGVIVAGAGPAGLMLAGELALAGVDVAIVERDESGELESSRSGGLHSRTIEVLDQRGIADRFLAAGRVLQVQRFAGIPLDISDFPTRHNYGLGLWQRDFVRILAGWVSELGVPVLRGREVTGFTPGEDGVGVELAGGASLGAQYLVGCDGGRSVVRKAAGIEFRGWDPSTSWLIAEVQLSEEPEVGMRRVNDGVQAIGPLAEAGRYRVVLSEPYVPEAGEPTLADLSEALIAAYGSDYGAHGPAWVSRFNDATRQAVSYRQGRVLLAGDAAHVHAPVGGQGLGTGVQDAVNLGWKLAQVVHGTAPDSLLDTYQAERHPVGARVQQNTLAQSGLNRTDARAEALREAVTELLSLDEPRKRFAGMISGLDIHYDLGQGHPLLGRRMPDLDLLAGDGPLRTYTLLHEARPVLLNLGQPGAVDLGPWAGRVRLAEASYAGRWELPVLGPVPAPAAVLIRPDGYVAWTGDERGLGLREALTTWFGPGAAA
jgi:3-(3-hydroxy-phenyl)propionate hydroxylase